MRTLRKKAITVENSTSDTTILSRGSAKYNTILLPRCGVPMDEGCTQPLSSDPKINLNTTIFFLIADVSLCEESLQVGASHPYNIDYNKTTRVRERIETHARARVVATTRTQVKKRAHKHSVANSQLNKCSNLKHNDSDACLRSIGVLGCSMEAWCAAPCA
jgi:hypothetical protein